MGDRSQSTSMRTLARVLIVAIGVAVMRRRSRGWLRALFEAINARIAWHKLPPVLGLLNLIVIRAMLREKNLHDTDKVASTRTMEAPPYSERVLTARTADGSYNDLENPTMGMAGTRFGRNFPLTELKAETEEQLIDPSPRLISRRLLARKEFVPATQLNVLAAAWIQFQVHDWVSHGEPPTEEPYSLAVDEDDDWHERPMRVRRTLADPSRAAGNGDGPPTFSNALTHWWDASAIYGSDEATQRKLRTFQDGKLIVENGRLPVDSATGIAITGFADNWWLGLGIMHTVFTLEHNAICDRLKKAYPAWSDDELFDKARLVNSALIAKIHTVEWTPAILDTATMRWAMRAQWWGLAGEGIARRIGRLSASEIISGIPGSPTKHHGVPFALTEEFVSVYRLHPLIPDEYEFRSLATGEVVKRATFKDIVLRDALSVVDERLSIADAIYSFGIAHPGAVVLHNFPQALRDFERPDGMRLDLAAVDVLRDRERGVPRYNQFRKMLRLPVARTFEELTPNPTWAQELREVYGDVDRVDLMVGMYAEAPPAGFGFSETAFRIFAVMASRRLQSDRFLSRDFNAKVYTQEGLDWVADNDMRTVFRRHYPEVAPALEGVENAFAPWKQVGRV